MLKTYSVLIAWSDTDREQGDYGATVRAPDEETAVAMVRAQMAASGEVELGEGEEAGGRVLECYEGAMWRAAQLEEALRGLVSASRCEELDEAMTKAKAIIAELDALPAYADV